MFKYFFWTIFLLILCAGILFFTLTQLDPVGLQSVLAISLFFVSLFGTVLLVCTYIFFFGAELFAGKNLSEKNFKHSLRRGFWVALFAVCIALLRLFNLLGWIETILMAFLLIVLELIFSIDNAKISQT